MACPQCMGPQIIIGIELVSMVFPTEQNHWSFIQPIEQMKCPPYCYLLFSLISTDLSLPSSFFTYFLFSVLVTWSPHPFGISLLISQYALLASAFCYGWIGRNHSQLIDDLWESTANPAIIPCHPIPCCLTGPPGPADSLHLGPLVQMRVCFSQWQSL